MIFLCKTPSRVCMTGLHARLVKPSGALPMRHVSLSIYSSSVIVLDLNLGSSALQVQTPMRYHY